MRIAALLTLLAAFAAAHARRGGQPDFYHAAAFRSCMPK
jgi:hypothetical protein